jgi:hypothetical protein
MAKFLTLIFALLVVGAGFAGKASAQTTEFTYQGSLKDGANPANGNYDFVFRLFDLPTGGTIVSSALNRPNVAVTGGVFKVDLDFGNVFPNAPRYLETSVRLTGAATFTVLAPREKVTSAPYSIKTITAENSLQLGGVAASQYVQTGDVRLSDARNPLPNSPNYIQNTTTQQAASNFNVSGNGTVGGTLTGNVVNSSTHFSVAGERILEVDGTSLAVGQNIFFGASDTDNTFVGNQAGFQTASSSNTFVGSQAGRINNTGTRNSFFGVRSGEDNNTGDNNSMFGFEAGKNVKGDSNSFFGSLSGTTDTDGFGNTLVGFRTDVGSSSLVNATAIGTRAMVSQSNSLVLGSINGVNNSLADTNVGIGTTAPERRLHVRGPSNVEVMIESSDVGGRKWTLQSSSAASGGRFEIVDRTAVANRFTILDDGNVGLGTNAPTDKLHVVGTIRVNTLGAAGSTHVCRNGNNQLSTCSADRGEAPMAIEQLRTEISALRDANAAQQRQLDEQRRQIESLIKALGPQKPGGEGETGRWETGDRR